MTKNGDWKIDLVRRLQSTLCSKCFEVFDWSIRRKNL